MAVLLKAREIREKLQGKIDPVVLDILCRFAEEHKQHNDHVHMLAQAYDRLVNMFTDMIAATGKIGQNTSNLMMKLGIGGSSGKGIGVDVSSIEQQDDDTGSTR
jgi:hypothetical protein